MATITHANLWICLDCTMVTANGEIGDETRVPADCPNHGGAWGEDENCENCTDETGAPRGASDVHGRKMGAHMGEGLPGIDLAAWMVLDADYDPDTGETIDGEEDFSTRDCDGCGDTDAGYRHRAVIIR